MAIMVPGVLAWPLPAKPAAALKIRRFLHLSRQGLHRDFLLTLHAIGLKLSFNEVGQSDREQKNSDQGPVRRPFIF
ncbi:hypothetical protein [Pseudorhodobacter sp.]|uniref:hypothetical protein n=1 Tax=Pseudorhodobacter sp. TaxID=1934400 RepID=UPI002AFE9B4B|nr:hypothetical protein [Pseudorhodobacter sp.]